MTTVLAATWQATVYRYDPLTGVITSVERSATPAP